MLEHILVRNACNVKIKIEYFGAKRLNLWKTHLYFDIH